MSIIRSACASIYNFSSYDVLVFPVLLSAPRNFQCGKEFGLRALPRRAVRAWSILCARAFRAWGRPVVHDRLVQSGEWHDCPAFGVDGLILGSVRGAFIRLLHFVRQFEFPST
jgi:hypothetical protein